MGVLDNGKKEEEKDFVLVLDLMNNQMEIVACTDKSFIMPTGVMMKSVCLNNKDSIINFHIVCDDSIKEKDKEDLKSVIQCSYSNFFFYFINGIEFDDMPALDNRFQIFLILFFYTVITNNMEIND